MPELASEMSSFLADYTFRQLLLVAIVPVLASVLAALLVKGTGRRPRAWGWRLGGLTILYLAGTFLLLFCTRSAKELVLSVPKKSPCRYAYAELVAKQRVPAHSVWLEVRGASERWVSEVPARQDSGGRWPPQVLDLGGSFAAGDVTFTYTVTALGANKAATERLRRRHSGALPSDFDETGLTQLASAQIARVDPRTWFPIATEALRATKGTERARLLGVYKHECIVGGDLSRCFAAAAAFDAEQREVERDEVLTKACDALVK